MADYHITRDLYLWCISVVYLFAFTSLYVQIPGLYGDNGILPVQLKVPKVPKNFEEFIRNQPTLLSVLPKIGLDASTGMDFLCLIGIVISFFMVISKSARDCIGYVVLWILYYSIYQVGQTFLWFQWDSLLLEAGFITILVAPMNLKLGRFSPLCYHNHDALTLWLVRWLLFRLMFASGVVKLTSGCPTWWGLTALIHHFESQCIPTPLAWYFHQLPDWFLKLSVVATYVIEIPIPFLFFSPVRSLRIFAFYAQMMLQVLIILTGNYNFFNLLTMTLCISLLDDDFLMSYVKKRKVTFKEGIDAIPFVGPLLRVLCILFFMSVIMFIFLVTKDLFNLDFNKDTWEVESKIGFSRGVFDDWLKKAVPVSIQVGVVSLVFVFIQTVFKSFKERGLPRKCNSLLGTVIFAAIAAMMFGISLVPYTGGVDGNSYKSLWPSLQSAYNKLDHFQLTNSYGLFRTMTGVGGRPELVIEGSNSQDGPWVEYDFDYKPGNLSWMPATVAPHQPRLDWQMWFAALGNYQHNPWFINLVYRLLTGEKEVLDLLHRNPFPDKPPTFIKASLYHYHYTALETKNKRYSKSDWWIREFQSEYIPILTITEPTLLQYLRHEGIVTDIKPTRPAPNYLSNTVKYIRAHVGQTNGFISVVGIFLTAILIRILDRLSSKWR